MNVKRTGQYTITSYGGDPRISGVQTRIESTRKKKFSMKKPLTAAIIAGAAALTIGLISMAESGKESLTMCAHKAKQENEYKTGEWNRRFSRNVIHADDQDDARRALNALLVEKEQIERKFQARMRECTKTD